MRRLLFRLRRALGRLLAVAGTLVAAARRRFSLRSALTLFLVVLVVAGVIVAVKRNVKYRWRWGDALEYLVRFEPEGDERVLRMGPLMTGLLVTLKVSVLSLGGALLLGFAAGLSRLSHEPILRSLTAAYVEIVRNTPLLVQLFIFYFFIGKAFELSALTSGVLALSTFAGAYVAEIVRAGIESVDPGQMEAARSLGMNHFQAMRTVVLPQAVRRTLPPLAGQLILLIKDSSLISTIAIVELVKSAQQSINWSFLHFELWFIVAGMYFVVCFALSLGVRWLERRMAAGRAG